MTFTSFSSGIGVGVWVRGGGVDAWIDCGCEAGVVDGLGERLVGYVSCPLVEK